MSVKFWGSNGVAFKRAKKLFVWSGGAWRQVRKAWAYNGSAWKLVFPTPEVLNEQAIQVPSTPGLSGVKARFDVSYNTESVRYRSRIEAGAFGAYTTLDVTPGATTVETPVRVSSAGDAITFQIEPYSGNALAGEAGVQRSVVALVP